ncbi:hypothetical protein K469DRAFT_695025 [Zopfia rhizophila CBS 207.26]|uniref:Uncharacterized protein n=1 Tax=Zopfia rhizophila CBS 207.26 TaxID=1314779 RepID=A0A6A6DI11_9PEZI|nr:hypothetical protein K469DRAFT_695025 [Zopfia rhizophila CBS 207.26]
MAKAILAPFLFCRYHRATSPTRKGRPGYRGSGESLAVEQLFDRSRLGLDDDAAGTRHGMGNIESGGGPPEYQDDDLDAAGMRALSVEDTEGVDNDSLLEQDESVYDDISITSGPLTTRKRKSALFADTITSLVEVLDRTSKPASEDSCSAKRRGSARLQWRVLYPALCVH